MASPALASLPEGSGRPSQSRSLGSVSQGSPISPRSSHAFSSPRIHPAPPSYKPGFPRFPAPQPPQGPTVGNFSRRPSAARCCPLTAGPGGSLPSPGPASSPAPPPARPPRGAAPNRCQPPRRPGHIWLRFAVILASPHQREKTTTRNNSPKPSPHRPLPPNSLPAPGLPAPLTARDRSAGGRGGGGLGPAPPSRAAPRRARLTPPSPDGL